MAPAEVHQIIFKLMVAKTVILLNQFSWGGDQGMRAIVAAACGSLFLSGCATVPDLDVDGISVAQIVTKVRCEILDAARTHPVLVRKKFVAEANLYLQVDDEVGVSPTLTYIHPLAAAATSFMFTGGVTLKQQRQRIYDESFSVNIAQLASRKLDCEGPALSNLGGDLGIREVVDIAFHSLQNSDGSTDFSTAGGHDTDAFGQTVQFAITKSINALGPMWTLTNFTGPGGFAEGSRIDTHKLIIGFAPGAGKSGQPGSAKAGDLNYRQLLQSLSVPLPRR